MAVVVAAQWQLRRRQVGGVPTVGGLACLFRGHCGSCSSSLLAWAPAGLLALLATYRSQRASGSHIARFGLVRERDSDTGLGAGRGGCARGPESSWLGVTRGWRATSVPRGRSLLSRALAEGGAEIGAAVALSLVALDRRLQHGVRRMPDVQRVWAGSCVTRLGPSVPYAIPFSSAFLCIPCVHLAGPRRGIGCWEVPA